LAALFVLATIALAGCGGDAGGERLTREDYASEADAVCKRYNDQVGELQRPSNIEELAEAADKSLPLLDDAIDELRDLRPPQREEQTAEQWLSQLELLRDDLAEIRDRAKDNDRAGLEAVVPSAEQHNARSNELATQLGMSVCNRGA
jgi:hypothetical protein